MILELIVLASSYCDHRISNGSRMNCDAITAASRDLDLGTCIQVKGVKILINDIGPCTSNWCIMNKPHILKRKLDFSYGAVKALGYKVPFLGKVKYKVVECKIELTSFKASGKVFISNGGEIENQNNKFKRKRY